LKEERSNSIGCVSTVPFSAEKVYVTSDIECEEKISKANYASIEHHVESCKHGRMHHNRKVSIEVASWLI
jgi:hypothetical protein